MGWVEAAVLKGFFWNCYTITGQRKKLLGKKFC